MLEKLIAVTRTSSKGLSIRITLPKEVADKLDVGEKEYIGFYEINGKLWSGRLSDRYHLDNRSGGTSGST